MTDETPHRQPRDAPALGQFADTLPPLARPQQTTAKRSDVEEQFGDYELLEEIARGGMGVVYKARQASLGRIVALKMILAGQFAAAEDVQRFHIEAEAAARLDHPGIVPIYEVGRHEGRHFFSMSFVEGRSLADLVAAGPLPAIESAQLVKMVAEAIHYAHSRGVIHRDLKPANILLSRREESERGDSGEGLAPGASSLHMHGVWSPKVTDFGLAKQVEGGQEMTATGQVLGTPGYMSPEQAAGRKRQIGPRSDIYSLGAVLYCLLTGRPPFQAATAMETLLLVLEHEPAPPRLLNARIERELESICLKCLSKDPGERYDSAQELADDLTRYLDGEPVRAGSVNLLDRVARGLSRSKHDFDFRAWSAILLWFAPIVAAAELGIFLHALGGPPYPLAWGTVIRGSQFAAMALVLWFFRRKWAVSAGAATRQMWALWTGFVICCHLVVAANFASTPTGQHVEVLNAYPYFAIISGLVFFVLGGSHWGYFYLIGAVFFAASLVMLASLLMAPLLFGLLWAGCLVLVGIRLRRLSALAAESGDSAAALSR